MAPELRTLDEHRAVILEAIEAGPVEAVALADALGLVVAEDVVAQVDLPGFDNSSMDGYAVQSRSVRGASVDGPVSLRLVGEVAAGQVPGMAVGAGEAVRIMTGAVLPDGADAVVAVEDTDGAASGSVEVRADAPTAQFVRRRGEDVTAGSVVVSRGELVGARSTAVLAATGHSQVPVHARTRVVILSTGTELVPPGEPLAPGQIHDSNSAMLRAAALTVGAKAVVRDAVGDTEEELLTALDEAVAQADVVITSGGVSMGAYDVVKAALRGRGVEFVQVAMQPGKPQGFGALTSADGRRVPIFALPGNPVSSYVSFHVFVRPALRRLMGHEPEVPQLELARITSDLRSSAGRRQIARAVVTAGEDGTLLAEPVQGQGSHFVGDLAKANALLVVPERVTHVPAGETVEVLLLDD